MMRPLRFALALCLLPVAAAHATDLYAHGNWAALASDRNARRVGDIVEIVISESAAATDTATNGSGRQTSVGGQAQAGTFNQGASLALQNDSNNTGTTGRSGGIVAQVSAKVDEVLPNGDLRVSGQQALNINGEVTNIKIRGVIRIADIAADNSVASSRLADAQIDYDGSGFVSRSAAPGIVTRIFNWLGI